MKTCQADMMYGACEGCPEADAGPADAAAPPFMGTCYRCISDDPFAIVCSEEITQSNGQRACLVGEEVRACSTLEGCCSALNRSTQEASCGDPCPTNFTGPECSDCVDRRAGPDCLDCEFPFGGDECTECTECADERFTGDECAECTNPQFTGDMCDECIERFAGPECDQCADRFIGESCSECEAAFTGATCQECRDPLTTGESCDVCRFGGTRIQVDALTMENQYELFYDAQGRLIADQRTDRPIRREYEYTDTLRTKGTLYYSGEVEGITTYTWSETGKGLVTETDGDEALAIGGDGNVIGGHPVDGAINARTTNTYDDADRLVRSLKVSGPDVDNGGIGNSTYDHFVMEYTYDAAGNQIRFEVTYPNDPDTNRWTIRTFNAAGQMLTEVSHRDGTSTRGTYTYDAQGNQSRREVDTGDDGTLDSIYDYTYDAQGLKVRKEADSDADGTPDAITLYTYGTRRLLIEHDSDADGTVDSSREMTWSGRRPVPYDPFDPDPTNYPNSRVDRDAAGVVTGGYYIRQSCDQG
jgi:YD repeat-containing protein